MSLKRVRRRGSGAPPPEDDGQPAALMRVLRGHLVVPRTGRALVFSAGDENPHCRMPVLAGRRVVLQVGCCGDLHARVRACAYTNTPRGAAGARAARARGIIAPNRSGWGGAAAQAWWRCGDRDGGETTSHGDMF